MSHLVQIEKSKSILEYIDEKGEVSLKQIKDSLNMTMRVARYHLKKLEDAGLVSSKFNLEDMRSPLYYSTPFLVRIKE